jgi:hypothetical protein
MSGCANDGAVVRASAAMRLLSKACIDSSSRARAPRVGDNLLPPNQRAILARCPGWN